jgi:hypothetical protein
MEKIIGHFIKSIIDRYLGLLIRYVFYKFILRKRINFKKLSEEDFENESIGCLFSLIIILTVIVIYIIKTYY